MTGTSGGDSRSHHAAFTRAALAAWLTLSSLLHAAAVLADPAPNWTVQSTQSDCSGAGSQGNATCSAYADDLYEDLDYSSAASARSADIAQMSAGYDSDYFYIEFDFVDAWSASQSTGHVVAIELDVDSGTESNRGDYFVSLFQKSEFNSSSWVDADDQGGYESYRDPNNDVGGNNPLSSDFGGGSGNGYNGTVSQQADRVWARIVNGNFQVAIRRSLVGSSRLVYLRGWSRQSNGLDQNKLYFHDHNAISDVDQIDNLAGLGTDQWIGVGEDYVPICVAASIGDDFPNVAYDQNSGTIDWSGDWTEVNESDGPSAGIARVRNDACSSGNCLRLGVASGNPSSSYTNRGVWREVNLGSAQSATLSFVRRIGRNQGSQTVTLSISDDGGASWTDLQSFFMNSTNLTPVTESFDISAYLSSNTRVRFLATGSNAVIGMYIDDIAIDACIVEHFSISHGGSVDLCGAASVTVAAHDGSHRVDPGYAGTIALSTSSGNGTWSVIDGFGTLNNTGGGSATYTFAGADNGDVELGLANSTAETLNIDVSDGASTEIPGEDPDLSFTGGGTDTFADDFAAVSFSGSSGSGAWSTNWLEINESNGAGSGDIRVTSNSGALRLRIKDNDGGGEGVQREADLSPYTSATLAFLYRRVGLDSVNDYVTIDVSSNGGASWTELDRFSGAGTDSNYQSANYDISAYLSANTRIRFLSSSSLGNNDIVYFDEVEISASAPAASCGVQLEISTAAGASTCVAHEVIVRAVDDGGSPVTDYSGTVTLSTSAGSGNWSVSAGAGALAPNPDNDDDGAASYTFAAGDLGQATLALSNQRATGLTITAQDLAEPVSVTSGIVSFADNAFVITNNEFAAPVAGRDHGFDVTLWQRDTSLPTPDCQIATAYDGSRALAGWFDPGTFHPGGAAAPAIAQGASDFALGQGVGSATPVTLTFNNGVASFALRTTDVGQYSFSLRDDTGGFATGTITGSAGEHTVRPFGLAITAIQSAIANPGGTTPGSAIFHSAGNNFQATLTGVLYQSGDPIDGNGEPTSWASLENNIPAPSFAWASQLGAVLNTPSAAVGGTAGTLDRPGGGSVAAAEYSAGAAVITDLRYSEVGSMLIAASAQNYLNVAGLTVAGESQAVGRFVPAAFTVSANTPTFDAACTAYTYLAQPFDYSSGASPQATITAVNGLGATTVNYFDFGGADDWWRLADFTETYSDASGTLAYNGAGASHNSAGNPAAGGQVVVTFQGTLVYDKTLPYADGPGIAPFNAAPQLSFSVIDADGVSYDGGAPFVFSVAEAAGQNTINHGRLWLQSAHGSELLNLSAPLLVQIFDGTGFVTAASDLCTSVTTGDFTYSNAPTADGVSGFAAGIGSLNWQCSAALPCASGFVDVQGNLGAANDWLLYDWNNDATEEEPSGRVTFGIYNGGNRHIHIREIY